MEIQLNIKSAYLRKYLDFLFEKKDDKFVVKTTNDFGRLLFALVKRSELPMPVEQSEQTVKFILPKSNNLEYYANNYYLYYDKIDVEQLNKYLETISDLDFMLYFQKHSNKKLKQKDIIDAYIVSRKMVFPKKDISEMLKKRVYRSEEKYFENLRKFLEIRLWNMLRKV